MKFLLLTAIDLRSEREALYAQQAAQAPAISPELDDLEMPVPAAVEAAPAPEIRTFPTRIEFSHSVREYHPRKPGEGRLSGTRIVYQTGSAQIVTETVAEIEAKLNSLNN